MDESLRHVVEAVDADVQGKREAVTEDEVEGRTFVELAEVVSRQEASQLHIMA